MKKTILIIILQLLESFAIAQDFKIIANNTNKRREITQTINSNGFIVGVNQYGGGYITQIEILGIKYLL